MKKTLAGILSLICCSAMAFGAGCGGLGGESDEWYEEMSVQKRRIGIFCRMPEDDRTCLFKMFRVLGCVRAYVAEGLYGGQKNIFFSGKVSQNPSIRLPTRSSMIGYERLAIFVPNSK